MKQPLGIVAVLYAGGLLLGNFVPLPLLCLVAISLAFAAGALLLPRFRRFLVWTLILFIGWTNFAWHTTVLSPTDLRAMLTDKPELVAVRGTLAETPTVRFYTDPVSGDSFNTTAHIKVSAIQRGASWQPASGQIVASVANILPEDFFTGQKVQVYGVIESPPKPIAEGLFDFRAFLRRQEIYFRLKSRSLNDWLVVSPGKVSPPLGCLFTKWAESALAPGLLTERNSVHLEQALTLGDKTYLTDQDAEPFVRAATYHILRWTACASRSSSEYSSRCFAHFGSRALFPDWC
jgi:hypothetical protein